MLQTTRSKIVNSEILNDETYRLMCLDTNYLAFVSVYLPFYVFSLLREPGYSKNRR